MRLHPRSVQPDAAAAALVAGALAAILLWVGPPGTDLAAHLYQRLFFVRHGFVLWNNFWYAGRYSFVTYSVLYYPLAALLGIKALALCSVMAAGFAFPAVVLRQWGSAGRLSAWTFALFWPGVVLSGAFPFALGAGLALLAVLALQAERRAAFAVLAVLTVAASPLAFAFLAVVLAGIALARRRPRSAVTVPAAVIVGVIVTEVVLRRLFPDGGRYPFAFVDLLPAVAFCGLGAFVTRRHERARALAGVFVAYAVACVAVYLVPLEIGSNIARLRFAAVPIALLAVGLAGWRPLRAAVPLVLVAAAWNGAALATSFSRTERDPAALSEYWRPAIRYLHRHLGLSYRVEAVDTSGHWPAAYLPDAGIPIVRGWYRQDDFPENALLYSRFRAQGYRSWLRTLGVRYVLLSDAPPDFSSEAEAALLRSGRSGLRVVWRTGTLALYELSHPRPIVTGPAAARILELVPSGALIEVGTPGVYRVALRYSPYWSANPGCVARGRDGMLRLRATKAGAIDLDFRVSATSALQTFAGVTSERCSPGATGESAPALAAG
jgi:hypothetical protein